MKTSSRKPSLSPHHQHSDERMRFQVERMILFTDAVFAIAITLLILEIKIPTLDYNNLNSQVIANALFSWQTIPNWIGFTIGFWVIALYWIDHHRTFAYVDNYDGRLIFWNFLFLMSICIMPFTSAIYSKFFNFNFPTQIYCANVAFTGFVKLIMWYYISNPKNKICNITIDHVRRKYLTARSWIAPLVFVIVAIIAPYTAFSRIMFMVIFVIQGFLGYYFEKKYGLKDRF
jgi:uncharacterized membrane protein